MAFLQHRWFWCFRIHWIIRISFATIAILVDRFHIYIGIILFGVRRCLFFSHFWVLFLVFFFTKFLLQLNGNIIWLNIFLTFLWILTRLFFIYLLNFSIEYFWITACVRIRFSAFAFWLWSHSTTTWTTTSTSSTTSYSESASLDNGCVVRWGLLIFIFRVLNWFSKLESGNILLHFCV